jgi:hypothetical protein
MLRRAQHMVSRARTSSLSSFELVGSLEERQALDGVRLKLFDLREERVHPGRDEKVLTSWNGLMLAAFAEAARVLDRDDGSTELAEVYREVTARNADFLLTGLRTPDGRLHHTWKARPEQGRRGGAAKGNGFLEDYTHLIEGLIELYQTTFDLRWYQAAHELAETMIEYFRVAEGFYDTSDDHEALIVRPRDGQSKGVPHQIGGVFLHTCDGYPSTKFYPSRQVVVPGQAVQEITPICFGMLSTTILERPPVLLSQSLSSHGTIRDLTARQKSSIILTKQNLLSKWP